MYQDPASPRAGDSATRGNQSYVGTSRLLVDFADREARGGLDGALNKARNAVVYLVSPTALINGDRAEHPEKANAPQAGEHNGPTNPAPRPRPQAGVVDDDARKSYAGPMAGPRTVVAAVRELYTGARPCLASGVLLRT